MRGLALNLGDTGRQHQGALGTVKDAQATVGEDEALATKNPAGRVPPAGATRDLCTRWSHKTHVMTDVDVQRPKAT